MDWDSPLFVIAIVAMVMVTAIIINWMESRAKAKRVAADDEASRRANLLEQENSALRGDVRRLEERLAVLERIATDPAERTAREIEQLRKEPGEVGQ